MGVYENLLPGKENALTPEYLTVKCHFSSVRMLQKKLASTVVRDLKGTAKSIKIIIPMPEVPKADITDYFEAGHTVEEFENLIRNVDDTEKICADVQQDQKQDIGKKRSVIQKNKDEVAGGPALVFKFLDCNYDEDGNVKSVKQLVHNFEVVMDKDSRFAGKIRLNEFAQQPYLYGSVPWENENNCRAWSSHDDSALFSLIQADYGLKSRQDFADALKNVSMRNKFHPVRELLDSLTWDGKEHIRSLLPEYLGAEDSDYTYQVMRLWMLGAVSRVYKPGSKFDYTIILQGSQGIGKSTFLKLMALDDSWFNDSLDSLDSDKAVQSLTGSWIIELAELKSLARTAGGVESVKRFLTATQDKYRIYDIFTDCWRLYKKLYPPGRPEDDVYWQGVVKEIEALRKNHHHSRLCEDLLLAVAKDLENKAKRNNPVASIKK